MSEGNKVYRMMVGVHSVIPREVEDLMRQAGYLDENNYMMILEVIEHRCMIERARQSRINWSFLVIALGLLILRFV